MLLFLLLQGLFQAMISLVFNEIAAYATSCRHYLHHHRQDAPAATTTPTAATTANPGQSSTSTGGPRGFRHGGGIGGGHRAGPSVNININTDSTDRRARNSKPDYTEVRLEVAMDIARTCLAMFSHLAHRGHCEAVLHSGVLAHL
ncbi:unnamed protein product, partial [Choristocarpus tenellus]